MLFHRCFGLAVALAPLVSATTKRHLKSRSDDKPSYPHDEKTTPYCTWWLDNDGIMECEEVTIAYNIRMVDFARWNPSITSACGNFQVQHSYCVGARDEPRPDQSALTTSSATAGTKPSASVTTTTTATTPTGPSPTQGGIINTCTKFYKSVSGDTCQVIVDSYGTFQLAEFIQWNPAVGTGCNKLLSDYFYCVGVPGTPITKPPTPGVSPTQPGIAANCKTFYKVESADTCQSIVDKYGTFTLDDFITWNPAVGSNCRSLWAKYYVCVGVPGTPTTKPRTGPSPTQPGLTKTCNKYYKAESGDTCQTIVDKHGSFSLNDFYKWNPAVKNDCRALWLGYYYCVSVPAAFSVRSFYHADCTGAMNNGATIDNDNNGVCLDTGCAVASLDIASAGSCPGGQVQISYWEQPGCVGKWFGYGYASRGTCRKMWTDGWKFKSVHLRCASEKDDCISQGTCKYDPEPAKGVC